MPEPNPKNPTNKRANILSYFLKYRSALYLILGTLFTCGIVFLITAQHPSIQLANLMRHPFLLFLNLLPIFLPAIVLFFLTRRALFSTSFIFACAILLSIAHRIKVSMRQDPLLPTDFALAKEALAIFRTFPQSQIICIYALILFFIIALLLLFFFSHEESLSWKTRLICLSLTLLAFFGSNYAWYQDKTLYGGFPVIYGNEYFLVNQYQSKGFIYSFLHQANIRKIPAPAHYARAYFDEIMAAETTIETNSKPHIIMIMSEAFSALSENTNLDFTDHRDPLQNFKAMAESEQALSGYIAVPNFGGGTSDTEYDVLTACPTRYLLNALPSFNFVQQNMDAIPYVLKQIGYDTLAIHPGYSWFYNRQNVYPRLGFDRSLFLEDSFDLNSQGIAGYISDEAAIDKIIDTLDSHIKEKDSPLFSFTVTIQNHGPYEKRYGTLPANFDTNIALTELESDLLTQYFTGVIHCDEALGRLQEYAQASEEPIVIVYFGDHLPGFSNGMDFFDILDYNIASGGSMAERLALYETPYLIWQNDSAEELFSFADNLEKAQLPESGILSSQYLGALLIELLDMDGLSPYLDFVNELRKEVPVAAKHIYVDKYGTYLSAPPEGIEDAIALQEKWQYYKLFDQRLY